MMGALDIALGLTALVVLGLVIVEKQNRQLDQVEIIAGIFSFFIVVLQLARSFGAS